MTLRLIVDLHGSDRDKTGYDYWTHPVRVMIRLGDDTNEVERHAALLHDTIEDTGITPVFLARKGYGPEVIHVVNLLSRQDHMTYNEYIESIARSDNDWAVRVKLADLYDNSAPSRVAALPESERGLTKRFDKSIARLERVLEDAAFVNLVRGDVDWGWFRHFSYKWSAFPELFVDEFACYLDSLTNAAVR